MTAATQWTGKAEQGELAEIARQIREDVVDMVWNAKSGHPGGSLSAAEILTCLYFREMRIDPERPDWPDRDRFVLSKGHAAPVLYSALARRGYFDPAYLPTLRQLHSPLQGHPHFGSLPGIETSTGSLGQGGGVAVGMALAGKLDGKDYKVYTLWGDGELEEGLVWESAMAAGHYGLDNLIGIVDWNGLQIDGDITEVMNPEPIDAKFTAFGWHVETADGHDPADLCRALERAQTFKGKPSLVLCKTVKGKGVSFMEGEGGWHGKAPDEAQWRQAIGELGGEAMPISPDEMKALVAKACEAIPHTELLAAAPDEGAKTASAKVSPYVIYAKGGEVAQGPATREAYGSTLADLAESHPQLVVLDADLSKSTMTAEFKKVAPARFFNAGIAEANMTCMGGGIAAAGKTVFVSTFAMFAAGRSYEQILNTIAGSGFNVKIAATHAGLSVGEDGMSHQMLSDIALMRSVPGLQVLAPADAAEASAMIRYLADHPGPAYIRLGRAKAPVVFDSAIAGPDYDPGQIQILREGGDVTLAACGVMVGAALEAADALAAEGVSARVLNVSCIKPLDTATLIAAAKETGAVVTCEEHNVLGGLGAAVAEALSETCPVPVLRLGVQDQFGQSGVPGSLLKLYGLDKEHIASMAKKAIAMKEVPAG
ncbi:MAG: transketolase [Clostridiales bacterium]|nr:transketolase [Clostridiales bacterium]